MLKMYRKLFLFTFLFLQIFFPMYSDQIPIVPVSFEGRFLPQEPYAKKWLFEIYHRSHLKEQDLNDFHTDSPLALNLIWQLHLHGHKPWDDSPFFWVRSAEVKDLLGLPLKQERFSYITLHHRIYEDPQTSWDVMQKLLIYHYLKTFQDPSNYGGRTTLELPQLSSGLWLTLQNHQLTLLENSGSAPWNTLKTGRVITDHIDLQSPIVNRSVLDDLQELMATMQRFNQLEGDQLALEEQYVKAYQQLKAKGIPSKQIAITLEQQFPLKTKLQAAGTLLKLLPGKLSEGEWYSLHALAVKDYDSTSDSLKPVSNFTLYSDETFKHLRELSSSLQQSFLKNDAQSQLESEKLKNEIFNLLAESYKGIESKAYKQAAGKQLRYPSHNQLSAEALYGNIPFIIICILGYALALITFALGYLLHKKGITSLGVAILLFTFLLHGILLALRSYILARPPVSNMFETLLYVPWIAVLTGLLLWVKYRHTLLMASAAATSLALLALLQITHIDSSFANVQAVLDSQYWLIIHVLLVVGSYGIFILGGVLGHLYLFGRAWQGKETENLKFLSQFILQTMYLGVAMLVPGTLLGGVWAAESWGRFWDWDPKESWAFISICVYIIWIHAYRFNKIGNFGLAIGAVTGLLAISFTWYGVNYILGTGLHSYGFGQGGEIYYYSYLIAEILFLGAVTLKRDKRVAKI